MAFLWLFDLILIEFEQVIRQIYRFCWCIEHRQQMPGVIPCVREARRRGNRWGNVYIEGGQHTATARERPEYLGSPCCLICKKQMAVAHAVSFTCSPTFSDTSRRFHPRCSETAEERHTDKHAEKGNMSIGSRKSIDGLSFESV